MAKTTELELAIKIAGSVDPSLYKSIGTAQSQVSSIAKGMQTAAKVAATATVAAVGIIGATFWDATQEAIQFESDMAGVVKVTEGLRDENGQLTDTYYEISDAIQDLSTQVPVSTEQLTSMAAIGAQSGVPVDELVQYSEDASKMAIAFEIDPTQAGEMMAKWRTAFRMDQDEVVLLADEINYLANRTSSSEEQIADVVTRIGNLGEIGGVSTETLAVLGSMLTSVGMESENAATAVKRMILEMTSGESVTQRQADVLDKLHISATDLAQGMQDDSVQTMQNFLQAILALPKAEQLSALNDFFGSWAVQGVSSLANNLPEMMGWLEKVSDINTYAGSMEQEYAGFATTTESAMMMLQNTWQVLKQDAGGYELDNVRLVILGIRDALLQVRDNLPTIMGRLDEAFGKLAQNAPWDEIVEKIPGAIEQIGDAIDYLLDHGETVAAVLKGIAAAWAGMMFAPQIEMAVKGASGIATGAVRLLAGSPAGTTIPGTAAKAASAAPGGLIGAVADYGAASIKRANNIGSAAGTIQQTIRENGLGAGISAIMPNLGALLGGNDIVVNDKARGVARRASAASVIAGTAQSLKVEKALSGASSLQMIRQTAGGMLSQTPAGKAAGAIGNYFGGIKAAADNVASTKIGGGILNGVRGIGQVSKEILLGILGPEETGFGDLAKGAFGAVKGGAGWVSGKAGLAASNFANSGVGQALGGAATIAGAAGKKAIGIGGTALGAITSFGGAGAGLVGSVLGPAAGIFGTIATSALPVVAVLGSIVAVVSILGENLDTIRTAIGSIFGDQGVAIFDGFLATVTNVKNAVMQAFSPQNIAAVRQSIVGVFGEGAGSAFDGLVGIGASIASLGQQIVQFGTGTVRPIFESAFGYISGTVVPMVINAFSTIAPYISQIISTVGGSIMQIATAIGQGILTIMPAVQQIATILLAVGSVVGPALLGSLSAMFTTISNVVSSLIGVFQGLIQFISGVFTGNWAQVWEGVKQIFGNAFDALVELCKAPLNAVIGLINGAINGINSILGNGITIPDWVPEQFGGGKTFSLSLPTIPMLATGGFTNGVSIAGEAGTEAVISFNPAYRSANIATWQTAGRMLGVSGPEVVAKEIYGEEEPAGGNEYWNARTSFTYAPQLTIQGNADRQEVERALDDSYEKFKANAERWERERRRRSY